MTRLLRIAAVSVLLGLSTPALAETCDIGRASFVPRGGLDRFVLTARREGDQVLWDLLVRRSSERFAFRTETSNGEHTFVSVSGPDGSDPQIRTRMSLLDGNGARTDNLNQIGHVSFVDLLREFMDYRKRSRTASDTYTDPPGGVWELQECRPATN